jgi:hypothetical protein
MHKMQFGQAYCQDILTKIIKKFISYFLSFISFSTYFRSLYEFQKFLKENEKTENRSTVLGWRLAHGLATLAWPSSQIAQLARAGGIVGAHPRHDHRIPRRQGGAAAGGSPSS